MKMKRIMALVMTSAMVMGTLAGCGASTDTTDATQSQSESSTAVTATEAASGENDSILHKILREVHSEKFARESLDPLPINIYNSEIQYFLPTAP